MSFLLVKVGTTNLVVCVALMSLESSLEVLILLLFDVCIITAAAGVWSVEEKVDDDDEVGDIDATKVCSRLYARTQNFCTNANSRGLTCSFSSVKLQSFSHCVNCQRWNWYMT